MQTYRGKIGLRFVIEAETQPGDEIDERTIRDAITKFTDGINEAGGMKCRVGQVTLRILPLTMNDVEIDWGN